MKANKTYSYKTLFEWCGGPQKYNIHTAKVSFREKNVFFLSQLSQPTCQNAKASTEVIPQLLTLK